MSRARRRRAGAGLGVGDTVRGRYHLVQKLGEGGMAEVFAAEDTADGRRVAIKVLHRDIAQNPEAVERTRREGEVLSRLDNPAIVSVETFGELDDGSIFLVMELLEGETLGARMLRGSFEPVELAPIVTGTCAGLHAAHSRGIVHRDLKPDNIFLCPTALGLQVKLLDFGISKVYGGQKLTQTGEVLGTPRYMSPEQLGAEHDVDARVDVYALGVILYEALAEQPPFIATQPTDLIIAILNGKVAPLRSVRPDVPAAVEAVVMRALSKVRAARFDTAMQLADAYIDAVGGVAAVRNQQRRGLATRALGGVQLVPATARTMPDTRPPPPANVEDGVAGNLRLGTFSGVVEPPPVDDAPRAPGPASVAEVGRAETIALGASRGAAVPPASGTARVVQPEPESWEGAAPRAIPSTRSPEEARAFPATRESPQIDADGSGEMERADPSGAWRSASPSGWGPDPAIFEREHPPSVDGADRSAPAWRDPSPTPPRAPKRIAATALMDASHVPSPASIAPGATAPPARRARWILVVGALLAGAGTAAAVIATLKWIKSQDETPREPAPISTPAEPPRAPPTAITEPSPAPPTSQAIPVGVAPEEVDEPETPRPRPRRTAPRAPAPAETPRPADPLRSAQDALRGGDPERCIAILDEAIRTGAPAFSLRRRADCYEAAGQREAAVRDYQRFCRLVPDHPSISEVRPLLEGWGRSCP